MPYSMTGFGRATVQSDSRELTIELKSVNHRFLDIGTRLPRTLTFLEETLRLCIQKSLHRGHVDVFVNYKNMRSDSRTVEVNATLADAYYQSLLSFKEKYTDIRDDISLLSIFRLPDVFEIVEKQEDREAIQSLCQQACDQALEQLKVMRKNEGEKLCSDIIERALMLKTSVENIETKASLSPKQYKQKLTERIRELLDEKIEIDQNKIATEVAFFADRTSVVEEIVRLKCHIDQLCELAKQSGPVGRKLDFLVQEMNREINTIGSKTTDIDVLEHVIDCKSEMEKMREQIQNIE